MSAVLLALTIIGLLVNRRYRLCYSFLVYCIACFVGNRLNTHWPETFFTPQFAAFKETLYAILKIAVALEIGLVAFGSFRRARRQVIGIASTVVLLGVLALTMPHQGGSILYVFTPRGQAGITALFAVVATVAVYYRIPLHPFHRGLLAGFAVYLLVYTLALALVYEHGLIAYPWYLALDRASYATTVAVWAWTTWRPAPAMTAIRSRLQPWAA